jgi:bacterioferritin
VISYVIYSQVLKGAQYMKIATELESHAAEELDHALKISKQIDYLGRMPTATPQPVKTSEKPEEMLRADLENERVTIANYRTRVRQADAMGEFALSEILREILVQEQDHLIDLSDALGIDPPQTGEAT